MTFKITLRDKSLIFILIWFNIIQRILLLAITDNVSCHMTSKITLHVKPLPTYFTLIRFLSRMYNAMSIEVPATNKGFAALSANMVPGSR